VEGNSEQLGEVTFKGGCFLEGKLGAGFWDKIDEAGKIAEEAQGRMAWFCSYSPLEIIASCGLSPYRLSGSEEPSPKADAYLHPNLCSLVRAILNRVLEMDDAEKPAGMVLVNSCNAMVHLYHVLKSYRFFGHHYLLELPRQFTPESVRYFSGVLREFHEELGSITGENPSREELWRQLQLYHKNRRFLLRLYAGQGENVVDASKMISLVKAFTMLPPQEFNRLSASLGPEQVMIPRADSSPRLFLVGSPVPPYLVELIKDLDGTVFTDDLCVGKRILDIPCTPEEGEDVYTYLARFYLQRAPCARMKSSFQRIDELRELCKQQRIQGVIFFNLKFCEPWYYLGQAIREELSEIPLLFLEGEYGASGEIGQMRTRIAAFLEMLT